MPATTPLATYQRAIQDQGFQPDPAQETAIHALQACYTALHDPSAAPARGLYLWGPVGRGKTWLMDSFYSSLKIPARRQHFHHFMRWVHRRLFQLCGTPDPVQALARELAADVRVLCFDELFVSDIGDAVLVGGLLLALFQERVVIVTTSNQPPRQLYAHGHNRERLIPAIEAIERQMQVIEIDGGQDHRLHPGVPCQRYWCRHPEQPSALDAVFNELCTGQPGEQTPVELGHQAIPVVARCQQVAWFRYADLCERPLAALDFIDLCDRFKVILLSDIPALGGEPQEGRIARGTEDAVQQVAAGDRHLPQLAVHDNGVRRFIALVDECYDRRIPLYLEAEVELHHLYTQGYLAFAFRRTLSRLQAMQQTRF